MWRSFPKNGNFNITKISKFYSIFCKIYSLKLTIRLMATVSLLYRIHKQSIVFHFFHKTFLWYQWSANYVCFLCVLKVAWRGLTVSVSSCCVSSFWCRIVETDLSLTAFVAGNTRCNLKSIVISEKNSLSTSEHCVMLLIIPGSFFIWFDKLNCVFLSCPCHVRVSEWIHTQ